MDMMRGINVQARGLNATNQGSSIWAWW